MNRIALTIATLALCSGTALGAGFRELTTQGVNVGVWYPSDTPTTAQRLGPFDTVMAKDAPVKSGKFEVVLMSHGLTGRYRNHHLTAQALADVGYIVIGPQHEADYLIGGSKTAQALNHRVTELAKALKGVREDPRFSNSLAASPVHGLGYSLGGATIMLASGAGYSSKKTEQYCSKNQNLDAEFCDDPGWIFRLVQSFKHDVKLAPTPHPFRPPPLVNGKVFTIAPVFQGIDLGGPLSMSHLTVIAADADIVAKPQFHAKPLFEEAKTKVGASFYTVPGHHFAFIAPFPKRVTDEEHIPIAIDPPSFNRMDFLKQVNGIVVKELGQK